MNLEMGQVIQIFVLFLTVGGIWVNIQSKLKEMDVRLRMLEKENRDIKHDISSILEKLDDIKEKMAENFLQLSNKINTK
jgi:hypothetical protein